MADETTKDAHTPGPWKIIDIPNSDAFGIVPQKRPKDIKAREVEDIASISKSCEQYDTRANARLIAAAPDLLAAAKLMVLAYQDSTCTIPACDCEMCQLVAAIAKAEGS